MSRNPLRIIVLASLAQCLAVACATNVKLAPFDTESWTRPDAPEKKRIAFVTEFSNSSDLGIRESGWSRFVSLTVGARRDTMIRPMAVVATNADDVVFVADPDAKCVHRYDIGHARYRCLAAGDNEPVVSPIGLAVTSDGWLFVSDPQQGRLFQAAPGSKRLEHFEVSSRLKQPTGMHWDDASQRLYVTDTAEQSVMVFDRDGTLLRTISGRGDLPGKFNFPTYLWVDSNNELLVADSLNFRVQRFDSSGTFLYAFGKNGDQAGEFARPKGVATDSLGHIYVIDALFHSMQIFDRQGGLLLSIGEQGQDQGQFWLPNGIFITKDNTIFVADSYNKRVQVFRYVGSEL